VRNENKRRKVMRDWTTDGFVVGRPYQSVHEESATQKYPIGTVYEAFGRRWRYCKAAATITPARRGCPNLAQNPWYAGGYSFGSDGCTATGLSGENYFDVTLSGDYDIERLVDCYQGGILTLYPSTGIPIWQYHILGNDLSHTTNTIVRIYVDPPLISDFTAVPVDGMPSPYMYVGDGESVGTQLSVVVVNELIITSGYYFWGQTRGPAWVTPNAGWTTAATREAEWHTNGTIKAAAGVALQRAGYLLVNNTDADDAIIMLQLE
jgi:hypothetical protein